MCLLLRARNSRFAREDIRNRPWAVVTMPISLRPIPLSSRAASTLEEETSAQTMLSVPAHGPERRCQAVVSCITWLSSADMLACC